MHEVTAYGLELESFVGEMAHLSEKGLLLVSGRLSPDTLTRDNDDRLHIIDVSDPTSPSPWLYGDQLTLKDDPFQVAVSEDQRRGYVVNLSDHSVSVIDTEAAPLELIDVVGPAELGQADFSDTDGSGSFAELDGPIEIDAAEVVTDRWTLSWLEGPFDSGFHATEALSGGIPVTASTTPPRVSGSSSTRASRTRSRKSATPSSRG